MMLILFFLSFFACQSLFAQDIKIEDYIETYKDIAIREMERSEIPASIKLAQGIHESAFGNSTLAKEARNHFGVKCGGTWQGKSYYRWDDELQKSCFRLYDNPEQSYIDHTEFLTTRKHYAFLFHYKRTDYKNWARGLRRAKYATDQKYPAKLISIIERYDLQQYDTMTGPLEFQPVPSSPEPPKPTVVFVRETEQRRKKPRSFLFPEYKTGIHRQNGASYIYAKKGESALALAARFDIPYARFLRFNDMEDGDLLLDYQYAYIQPKRNSYQGDSLWHLVEKDERIYEIAQYYGIRLSKLRELNKLEKGEEPATGQYIYLKMAASQKPPLRPASHEDLLPEEKQEEKPAPKPLLRPEPTPRPEAQPLRLNERLYPEAIYQPDNQLNTTTDSLRLVPQKPEPPSQPGWYEREKPEALPAEKPEAAKPYILPEQPAKPMRIDTSKVPALDPNPFELDNEAFDQQFEPGYNPPIAKPSEPKPAAVLRKHTVVSGDSLGLLAKKYGTTVRAIQEANDLQGELIKIGQVLEIP